MAKVIVERPRRGGKWAKRAAHRRGRLRVERRDFEEAPKRGGMGRGYTTKYLNENLAPLERFVGRHVGRPWRLVHAEIAARISVRSAVQKHVLDHLRDIVAEHVWRENGRLLYSGRWGGVRELGALGSSSWPRFYVCPRTGLVRRVVPVRSPSGR